MSEETKVKIVHASLSAAIMVSVLIVAMTIGAELMPVFKSWLKASFGHHWTGKSVLSFISYIVFFVLALILPLGGHSAKIATHLWVLFWTSIASSLAIFLFFVYEAFLK